MSELAKLRKLAEKGVYQTPIGKYNEYRARWLHWALHQPWGYTSGYFREEWKQMPEMLKRIAEGGMVA